ncbi:type IX secretion system membrane protein PorP/SprF [Pontibacter silvestris]|uniref:Type IX secretion system membrane protein PorP/SprF n=1 Tax=Pontibacter silvestris TaxID=2305183 RepID=A0ABW4X1V1_9BACT|nr:type IX secretion system membrane protein PorP/SprF [Pontibacter silvestris]MCC9135785.1 type IX secretion system membrane protein PorP/SprF [Pontibacter silvestris]
MRNFLHKFSLVAVFLLMISGAAFAQQEAMYSQYMFNGLVLNPAYAGSNEGLSAAALYRNQWVGVEGAPVTQTLSVHAPLQNNRVGLGFSVVNDEIGVTNTLSMNGIYAFRIRTESGVFSMGLQAGFTKIHADYTKVALNPQSGTDVQFNDVQNFLSFNVGNGLYYYTDKFYAGVSVPNLFRTRISGANDNSAYPGHARHYFLSTGYVFTLNENVQIKPSTIIKAAEGAPVQFDINTNVWLHNFIGLGASYRSSNALVGLVELQVSRQFRVGYAYDHPVSSLNRYTTNTHEVMLRFDLFSEGERYVSPRLF